MDNIQLLEVNIENRQFNLHQHIHFRYYAYEAYFIYLLLRQKLKVKLSYRIKIWEFEKSNLTEVTKKDLEDLGN